MGRDYADQGYACQHGAEEGVEGQVAGWSHSSCVVLHHPETSD